jgi:DNA modification methylase
VVLDPFVGVGTSVVVAEKNGRFGVGMDLSLDYLVDIALKKIRVPIQKMLELRW